MSTTTTTTNPLRPTHRALIQTTYATAPTVQTIPTPHPHPGAITLHVLTANLISYIRDIYNGTRHYPYPTPLTLGTSALCRVAAVPHDATHLKPGMLVVYDSLIRSRDNPRDLFLHAIYDGDSEGSKALFRDVWRDGSFAEYVRVPLENVYALAAGRWRGGNEQGGLG